MMKTLATLILFSSQIYAQEQENKCLTIMPKDLTVCENQWEPVYDLADMSHGSPTHGFHLGYIRKIHEDGMLEVDKEIDMNLAFVKPSEDLDFLNIGKQVTIQSWYVLPENVVVSRAEMNGVGAGTVVVYNRKKYRVEAVYDNGKNHPGYYYITKIGIVRQDFAPKAKTFEPVKNESTEAEVIEGSLEN
ncbi:MAG: hypothetical protein JNM93_01105 [Bacteriovoracaceae bacterium]|nr:hypothetical protein [Bacteriovoracaceae bacterium]